MSKKKVLPQYRAQYLTDTFVDYAGRERMFTLCAVSIDLIKKNYGALVGSYYEEVDEDSGLEFVKELRLGMAVQDADDMPEAEIGKKVAYGKALTYNDHVLTVTHAGMVNTLMVETLLKQEAEYFKRNPASYIAGYNTYKFRYFKEKENAETQCLDETQLYNEVQQELMAKECETIDYAEVEKALNEYDAAEFEATENILNSRESAPFKMI